MPKPTILGRAMRYVAEARAYAVAELKSSVPATMRPIFDGMEREASWASQDDLSNEKKYQYAVTSAWVHADIDLLANRVSADAARFEAKQRDGRDLVDLGNHEIERLLDTPNALHSGSFLRRYLAMWYLLSGNAYAVIATDRPFGGEPLELWPLPASRVRPIRKQRERKIGEGVTVDYQYYVAGEWQNIPGEHMLHFRTPNLFDYWLGMSPLTAAFGAVQSDNAQQVWQRDFFSKHNAVPTAVVSVPQETDERLFETLRTAFYEEFGGKRGSLFTRSGDIDVEVITQTLEQMQILESRRFNRDEIDAVYHIPEGMQSGATSGDSRLALEISLGRNATQPLADAFAGTLTQGLVPFYGEENLVVTAPSLVPQERALEMQEYQAHKSVRTLNENRAELKLDEWQPTPEQTAAIQEMWGVDDVAELGNIPERVLDALRDGGAKLKGAPKPEPFGGMSPFGQRDDDEPEDETDADEDTGDLGADEDQEQDDDEPGVAAMQGAPSPTAQAQQTQQKAAWLGVETEIGRWQKVALKEMREGRAPVERAFETDVIPGDLQESIKVALELCHSEEDVKTAFTPPFALKIDRTYSTGDVDPLGGAKDKSESRLVRLLKVRLNGHLASIVDKLGEPPDLALLDAAFWDAEQAEVIRVLRPELQRMALEAAEAVLETVIVDVDWALIVADASDWAYEHAGDLARGFTAVDREYVGRVVGRFFETPGMTRGELVSDLRRMFGEVRANRIAVTEVTTAYAEGQRISWQRTRGTEFETVPVWHTLKDELVCPLCGPMEMATFRNGMWMKAGTTDVPVENQPPYGWAPFHVGCRCSIEQIWGR